MPHGNVFALIGGPTAGNERELKHLLEAQPQYELSLQGYHRVEDQLDPDHTKEFRPIFVHPARAIVVFQPEKILPEHSMTSVTTVRVHCNITSINTPDAIAASTPLITNLRPYFDVIVDYIVERGIGFIRGYGVFFDWFDDPSLIPHLMTSINLDAMRDCLKIIDKTSTSVWTATGPSAAPSGQITTPSPYASHG